MKKLAESMNGSAVSWIVAKARQKNAHILGSVIIEEDKKYFNRLVWAKPDGEIMTYDKKHLFQNGRRAQGVLTGKQSSHR